MKTVPLLVLGYEGPSVRAYLKRMRMGGNRPSRVALMVPRGESGRGDGIGRLLPGGLRERYAARCQAAANGYWPSLIWRKHSGLVCSMVESMGSVVEGARELAEAMVGPFAYGKYCDELDRVSVSGLKDEGLAEYLGSVREEVVLYAGGGDVPYGLLGIEGLKLLHVHPGRLPDVRGEDGVLWCAMMDGHPSMSCLYMGEDVDRGQLIAVKEYEPLRFEVGDGLRPDDDTLHEALRCFCEPMLRAEMLVGEVLGKYDNPAEIPVIEQDSGEGTRHHFMHERIRHQVLGKVFRGGKTLGGYDGVDVLAACPA